MYLALKDRSVELNGLHISMLKALDVAMRAYRIRGFDPLVVTSARDGQHREGSKHYAGKAVDLRVWGLSNPSVVASDIQEALGPDYDVIFETDHIHIEYDPKD